MISERTFLEKVTDSLTIYHLSWFTNTAWCWHCHIIENRHKWKRDDVNILLHKQAPAEKMLKLHSAYVIIKCVSDVFSRPCLFQCTKELTRMMLLAYNLTLLMTLRDLPRVLVYLALCRIRLCLIGFRGKVRVLAALWSLSLGWICTMAAQ